jgi:hypothetical protein
MQNRTLKAPSLALYFALIIFIFSLIFIRIYHSKSVFLIINSGDDLGYFVYTEALLKTHTFDWCSDKFENKFSCPDYLAREYAQTGQRVYNKYSPGPALLLLPFTAFGFVLDKLGVFTPYGLDALRFWSVVGTFFLFAGGTLSLLLLALQILKDKREALLTTVFFLCGNMVLYYVFRRPLMSHAAEFFLIFFGFYLCGKMLTFKKPPLAFTFLIGVVASMITVARHNDLPMSAFIFFWVLYFEFWKNQKFKISLKSIFSRNLMVFVFGAALPLLCFGLIYYLQTGKLLYNVSAYTAAYDTTNKTGFAMMYNLNKLVFLRMLDLILGPHWGILWLMPVLIFEAGIIALKFKKIVSVFKTHKILLWGTGILFFVQLNIVANYTANSMSYGNRYMLPLIYGLHIIFLLALKQSSTQILRKKAILITLTFLTLLGTFNVINFESNSTTLTLTNGPAGDEGILDPAKKDFIELRAPYYVTYSLKHTLSGQAFQNLGASPLAAYPLFVIKPLLNMEKPAWQKVFSYYESPKREIHSLGDLKLLFQYHMAILILLGLALFLAFKRGWAKE